MGVIDRITLINFMCHKRLDVHLNPNTNFILGRNGSEFVVCVLLLWIVIIFIGYTPRGRLLAKSLSNQA